MSCFSAIVETIPLKSESAHASGCKLSKCYMQGTRRFCEGGGLMRDSGNDSTRGGVVDIV